MMKIQVGGLSEGRHQFHFSAAGVDLGLEGGVPGEVQVDATLEKSGHQMLLTARIARTGTFVCDRCLEGFPLSVNTSYRMFYVMDGEDGQGLDPAEVQAIPPGQGVIDIAEDVRQTVELSIPLKLLCRNDCRGLCPRCGKNLNGGPCGCPSDTPDSRWDALKSLKNNPT